MSRQRLKILTLSKRLRSVLETILGRSELFPGWLYEQKVRCGKTQCKCAKGKYRHRMKCISYVEEGKSRTRVVKTGEHAAVAKMTGDYRRFRQAHRQLRKLCDELLAAVDAVGRARCEQGKKRYRRLVAESSSGGSAKSNKKGERR